MRKVAFWVSTAPLAIALAPMAAAQEAAPAAAPSTSAVEIIVTANKRAQSVQDIPQSVTALTGEALQDIGAQTFTDYVNKVPGLNFYSAGAGETRYAIRGVASTSVDTPDIATVGYYLDEVPISESSNGADLAPFDVQRIEVLRGPQGTLYGEGSIGGTIKVITNRANVGGFEAAYQVTGSQTHEGGENSDLNGMVNVPLVKDQLALRAVVSHRDASGYIDNPFTGAEDINHERRTSGRLALAYEPTSRFSADLTGYYVFQDTGAFNQDLSRAQDFIPNISGLVPSAPATSFVANTLPDLTSPYARDVASQSQRYVANLTMRYDLGWADLVSSTSGYWLRYDLEADSRSTSALVEQGLTALAPAFASPLAPLLDAALAQRGLTQASFLTALDGTPFDQLSRTELFSQEVRLASKDDQRLRWLVGAFYRDRTNELDQAVTSENVAAARSLLPIIGSMGALPAGPGSPLVFGGSQSVQFEQIALFGEATFDVTERLSVTGGFRAFREEVSGAASYTTTDQTPPSLGGQFGLISVSTAADQEEEDVLFKASVSYEVGEDALLYASYAEGVRAGGVNSRLLAPWLPGTFQPDETKNYEIGLKSRVLDDRLVFNASAFLLEWDNTQVYGGPAGGEGVYNVEDGVEVRGVEAEARAFVTDALEMGGSFGYLESETQGPVTFFNSLFAPTQFSVPAGVETSNMPNQKGSLFAEYRFVGDGFVIAPRVDFEYVGARKAALPANSYRLKAYELVNLRLAYERDAFAVTLFADNVGDERVETQAGTEGAREIFGVAVGRPRTIGVTVSGRF